MAPYALRQGDEGMVGPADKAPPHEATVMPGDILIYDALRCPKAGDLVVVNLSRGKTRNFSARQLVVEDDDLYFAPLSREFERIRVERGAIAGVVRQLQRSFISS